MKRIEQSPYIKRLKERLSERPDSKLFLSLAEELRKAERIDEAITLLVEGVRKNPDFVAAHVTLGRWYLSKGMIAEAKEEFLEAAERSPQNIFARKGLVEAYKRLGDAERAIAECKRVLATDPLDEEARTCLSHFDCSIESAEGRTSVAEDEDEVRAAAEPLEAQQMLERADPEGESAGARYESDAASISPDLSSSAPASGAEQAPGPPHLPVSELIREADVYIAEGRFAKAMQLYHRILSSNPDQKTVLQKREELRFLMRLTGYDSGRIVARLNRFSELIKERFARQRAQRREIAVGRLTRLLGAMRSLGQAQAS